MVTSGKNKIRQIKHNSIEITDKISLDTVQLQKLNFAQTSFTTESDQISVKIKIDNKLSIEYLSEKSLILKNTVNILFDPEGPFILESEILGFFDLEEEINEEDIQDQIENLGYPLLSHSTLLIAQLTEKIMSIPIIIPPSTINRNEDDESDD